MDYLVQTGGYKPPAATQSYRPVAMMGCTDCVTASRCAHSTQAVRPLPTDQVIFFVMSVSAVHGQPHGDAQIYSVGATADGLTTRVVDIYQ